MRTFVGFWTFVVLLSWKLTIWSDFQKKVSIRSRVCHMVLIRSALKSPDSGRCNGGSNLLIRWFGADLVTFEMVELSHYCRDFYQWISRFWSYPATSKVTRSAPNSRINKLDTPFDAPSSVSSSALRINIVRQTHERMKHFLWKPRLKSTTNYNGTHGTRAQVTCEMMFTTSSGKSCPKLNNASSSCRVRASCSSFRQEFFISYDVRQVRRRPYR